MTRSNRDGLMRSLVWASSERYFFIPSRRVPSVFLTLGVFIESNAPFTSVPTPLDPPPLLRPPTSHREPPKGPVPSLFRLPPSTTQHLLAVTVTTRDAVGGG